VDEKTGALTPIYAKESIMKQKSPKAARRAMLGWLAAAPAMAFIGKALAQAGKAKKSAMKYQDKPKDGKDCDDCIQFIPGKTAKSPGTCKVVEGPISPSGWCMVFQAKPKKG
jgi:hypothetical protein